MPITTLRDVHVLYRDDHLVAIDKPSGMLVHRGWANDGVVALTIVRDLIGAHVYPVHRLDRGTSGVLVFAQSSAIAAQMQAEFEAGRVGKRYIAVVRGVPADHGVIDHPLPRREGSGRVPAKTLYQRVHVFGRYSIVVAEPETGRLHQVRRHLKHISCPIIGDSNYGKGEHNRLFRQRYGFHRLALHAASLACVHPATGRPFEVSAPLAVEMRVLLAELAVPADWLAQHG